MYLGFTASSSYKFLRPFAVSRAHGSLMAPPEKAGGSTGKADNQEMDDRFAAVSTDPRFRRFPKKESKVKIDDRFAGIMCTTRVSTTMYPTWSTVLS